MGFLKLTEYPMGLTDCNTILELIFHKEYFKVI